MAWLTVNQVSKKTNKENSHESTILYDNKTKRLFYNKGIALKYAVTLTDISKSGPQITMSNEYVSRQCHMFW